MAKALCPIDHEERLSLVEHLDELRSRLIVSLGALIVAFGICFWQNHRLLNLLQSPVNKVLKSQARKGQGLEGQATQASNALLGLSHDMTALAKQLTKPGSGVSVGVRRAASSLVSELPRAFSQ